MSHDEGGNVVFPTVGKNNEPGIIICSFHAVGIAVGRTGLVSYHGFGWQHTFQFVSTGFSIYHGLPQSLSAPCWKTTLFHRPILSSRAHSGRNTPVAVYSLEAGVHVVFCFREVEGVDTQPADIVIDMFNLLHILSRCRRHCCRFGKCCIMHPKAVREILLPQGAVGIGQHLGCLYGNNAVQADALLIHLVQYGQCHMEFEYTEQGKCTWSLYRSMSPLSVHTAIPNGGFLAIEKTVNPVFKFRHLLRPDDGSHTSE